MNRCTGLEVEAMCAGEEEGDAACPCEDILGIVLGYVSCKLEGRQTREGTRKKRREETCVYRCVHFLPAGEYNADFASWFVESEGCDGSEEAAVVFWEGVEVEELVEFVRGSVSW
jgi:hypothetical protein